MNNDMEDKILEKVQSKISIIKFNEELNNNSNTYKETPKIGKRIFATACASLALVSGIAIATNINNIKRYFDRGLGNGIETAINNGYIEEVNSNFANLDDIGVDIRLQNFLMDNTNLSANLVFVFDEIANKKININKVYEIELRDIIIRDEKNRILYGGNDEDRFKTYCEEHNLDYKFCEFNNNYMGSGVQCFIESKGNGRVNLLYNMYTDCFPKSKKLYISLTKILMKEMPQEDNIEYTINGNWEIEVDVPSKMYERTEEYYKVVTCDNKNFDVYMAKVTNTGFEFGVIISNIEEPKYDDEKRKEYDIALYAYRCGEISEEEFEKKASWYYNYSDLRNPITTMNFNNKGEEIVVSYVETTKGEKFEAILSPSRISKRKFIENNKYDFYETFSMTKYDETDKIKVILYYYGNPVTIELEKIK